MRRLITRLPPQIPQGNEMADFPDRALLLLAAGMTEDTTVFDLTDALQEIGTLPDNEADRRKRSALFLLLLANTFDLGEESAFRDTLRDLMHASVDFGVNWTDETRMGWQDVRGERSRLKPSPAPDMGDGGEIWIEGVTD